MRKIVSFVLCFLLLLTGVVSVRAEETVYKITTLEELLTFAESCRLDRFSQGLTVSLEADIDLTGTDFSPIPIFCGTFLGNDHKITGLSVTVTGSVQGFFRYLTETAQVQQLHIEGAVAPKGSRTSVGGIAGSNAGVISKCSFTGAVVGTDGVGGIVGTNTVSGIVEECKTGGEIAGTHFVGGVAGQNAGVIRNSENAAKVNTTARQNDVDISDITVGALLGTEAVNVVTDIGGIAGGNMGVIRSSKNTADVGYKHMGYNIGGIAGSQTGFITDSENFGTVSGRKDVGGIVGHMEPAVQVDYETDTLQMLRAELAVLSDLTDRAMLNSESNSANIQQLTLQMESHIASAQAALDVLTTLQPEADTYLAALQNLSSSLAGMGSTLQKLNTAVQETGTDLRNDLNAIQEQMKVIDGLLETGEEHLGGSVQDVSDEDTPEDLTSKLLQIKNHGPVLGDWNVGGIVGTVAPENDLDPEEDVHITGSLSFNVSGKLRSVILESVNKGTVTAKKQNAGGIVGWQSMGLVKDSINAGGVSGGDYAGGVAGQSLAYIRSSHANCSVTGGSFVGGIAGSGTVVTDCRSLTKISGTERVGAILGLAEDNHTDVEQPIAGNLYVSAGADCGAVDGISYAGIAEAISLEAFLTTAELPDIFQTVQVTFRFADGTDQVLTLAAGQSLQQTDVPEVPKKAGFTGQWGGISYEPVLFDVCYEAVYTNHGITVQSQESQNGKPLFLAQGDFLPGSQVVLSKPDAQFEPNGKESVLQQWSFEFSNCEKVEKGRYLIPEGVARDRLTVYLHTDGSWQKADFTVSGNYLVFALTAGCDGIAVCRDTGFRMPWGVLGIGLAVVAVAVVTVIAVRKKKKQGAPAE